MGRDDEGGHKDRRPHLQHAAYGPGLCARALPSARNATGNPPVGDAEGSRESCCRYCASRTRWLQVLAVIPGWRKLSRHCGMLARSVRYWTHHHGEMPEGAMQAEREAQEHVARLAAPPPAAFWPWTSVRCVWTRLTPPSILRNPQSKGVTMSTQVSNTDSPHLRRVAPGRRSASRWP